MKVVRNEKHFTSSVWLITNNSPKKVLLVFHKKFNLWLQPGGHIEKFENPIEAVIRETYEETGIDISFLKNDIKEMKVSFSLPAPSFILEERIPAFEDQPEHFHIDLMYIVRIPETKFRLNNKETKGIGFFTKSDALELPTHDDSKLIIQKILK